MGSEEETPIATTQEPGVLEGPTHVMEAPTLEKLLAESVRPDASVIEAAEKAELAAASAARSPIRSAIDAIVARLPKRARSRVLLIALLVGVGIGIILTLTTRLLVR